MSYQPRFRSLTVSRPDVGGYSVCIGWPFDYYYHQRMNFDCNIGNILFSYQEKRPLTGR